MNPKNNPLNLAASLAARPVKSTPFDASAITQNLGRSDTGIEDARLNWLDRIKAGRHGSRQALTTAKQLIDERETQIRDLCAENIRAQATLLRARLKQRFDSEYAVIAQEGLATFQAAQRGFYAIVDAGVDCVHDDLSQRAQDLTTRYQSGLLSDNTYRKELMRAQRNADTQTDELEAACQQRLNAIKATFNS